MFSHAFFTEGQLKSEYGQVIRSQKKSINVIMYPLIFNISNHPVLIPGILQEK